MDAMKISNTEYVVMDVIWRHEGPITFAQIRKELNGSDWAAATIRSMVRRLVSKKILIQNEIDGDHYTFAPTVTREEYVQAQTQDLIKRVYGGDVKELKAALTDYEVDEKNLDDLKSQWRRRRKEG